jgi:hypothetical protein
MSHFLNTLTCTFVQTLPQIISTIFLFVWAVYYVVLLVVTAGYSPHLPPKSDQDMHDMQTLGTAYSSWLWGYIVVTGLLTVRMVRYMRIHVGLRAFYQVRRSMGADQHMMQLWAVQALNCTRPFDARRICRCFSPVCLFAVALRESDQGCCRDVARAQRKRWHAAP